MIVARKHVRNASFALAVALFLAVPRARAEERGSAAFPIGVRVRHGAPGSPTSVEAMFAATLNIAKDGKSMASHGLGAIGSDGSKLTGTFAYAVSYGAVFGESGDVTQGLLLRSGVDVLVDSLGGLKASHLSLPLLESGYAYGSEAVQFEVGAHGAPVLAGRLRLNDSVRRMGLGAKGGPFLNLMLLKLGVSFRASADHLIASTTSGGASDWVQGLLCLDLGWFATCADGFAARFAETSDSAKQTMGYGGLSFGFNLVKFGEQFSRGMR